MKPDNYRSRLDAFSTLYAAEALRNETPDTSALSERARRLVDGVKANQAAIDAANTHRRWGMRCSRMPSVDRNILRIAAYELMFTDLSHAIVIDEAVNLAKEYSTAGSGRFVNGVLDTLATAVRGSVTPDS